MDSGTHRASSQAGLASIRAGVIPTMPRIELLIENDPDSGAHITVFLNGKELSNGEYVEHVVDPGAGWGLEDWDQETEEIRGLVALTPAYRDAVIEARDSAAEHSEYID